MRMDPEEHDLIAAAQKGDAGAAGQLVERFYERVFAFLRRLTHNDADAADLTQRSFSRIWQALPTFAGRSSVNCWMHGIAYHVYIDWRRGNHHTEDRTEAWWAARPAPGDTPAEQAAENDLARALYRKVDGLAPELSEPVHLHYFQELSLDETAESMGVATSTIKYRLRQAVGELRKALAAEPPAFTGLSTARSTL